MAIIETKGLSKIFHTGGKEVTALDNVDLNIQKNDFALIKGPSGCGKSTLLFAMGGLLNPSAGAVRVSDREMYSLSEKERLKYRSRVIVFVFQSYYLLPYLSVSENIRIFSSGMVRIHTDGLLENIEESLTYLPPLQIYEIDPDTVNQPTYFNQFQIIRKNDWKEYPFNETTNGEDIDYMLHHLLKGKFKKIPQYLYFYRFTPNSFSEKKYPQGDICTQRYQTKYYKNYYDKNYNSKFECNFKNIS